MDIAKRTNVKSVTSAKYAICTVLLPFVLMGYQYQRNIEYLSLLHVSLLCCLLSLVVLALYFLARLLIKSSFGSFVFTAVLFCAFFMFGILRSATLAFLNLVGLSNNELRGILGLFSITSWTPIYIIFIILLFIIAGLFAFLLKRICSKHSKRFDSNTLFTVIIVIMSVMLLQSIIGIIMFANRQKSRDEYYKEVFQVDAELEHKYNIFWFHCDGMLGFDSMSRFFGDNQDWYTQELESRGFIINREAGFEARHSTQYALPTLMNPFYYDNVLSWLFDPAYAEYRLINAELGNNSVRLEPNKTSNRIARERNELVMAFNAAEYNTSTLANIDVYFYPTVNQFYSRGVLMESTQSVEDILSHVNKISSLQNLVDLLSMLSPLPNSMSSVFRQHFNKLNTNNFISTDVPQVLDVFGDLSDNSSNKALIKNLNVQANALYDVMNLPYEKFTIINYTMPHRPFVYDENGNYDANDADNPQRYPAHHLFSAKTLLKYIDLILEHDPKAIIVLQADHGLHGIDNMGGIDALIDTFSCSEEELVALWNQVMSAVRIPDEHKTSETIAILSDPRNISRWLINTFVGWNYDYIPIEFKQVYKGP